MRNKVCLSLVAGMLTLTGSAFGWGELGHQLIGRTAAKILGQHPLLAKKGTKEERARIGAFVGLMKSRWLMEGHIANIPDIYWRNLDGGLEEDGKMLGDAAHFLNAESYLSVTPDKVNTPLDFLGIGFPLGYEQANHKFSALSPNADFFHTGTMPWRAQQFATLYFWALKHASELDAAHDAAVKRNATTVPAPAAEIALAYAGLMSHMTGDSSQPYHVTSDYDGQATGQKGIHSYFESTMVNALEDEGLLWKVEKEAGQRMTAGSGNGTVADLRDVVTQAFPGADADEALEGSGLAQLDGVGSAQKQDGVAALTLALIGDSYAHIKDVRSIDETFAVATLADLKTNERCESLPQVKALKAKLTDAQGEERETLLATKLLSPTDVKGEKIPAACRRSPFAHVDDDGNEVRSKSEPVLSKRYESIIVSRLALAAAVTADIWARLYVLAGEPKLDFTYQYALKPAFVSPTDAKCAGYALNENPAHFTLKNGTSALPFKAAPASTAACIHF